MLKEIPPRRQRQDAVRQLLRRFADASAVEFRKAAVEWGTSSGVPSAQTPLAKSGSESTK